MLQAGLAHHTQSRRWPPLEDILDQGFDFIFV